MHGGSPRSSTHPVECTALPNAALAAGAGSLARARAPAAGSPHTDLRRAALHHGAARTRPACTLARGARFLRSRFAAGGRFAHGRLARGSGFPATAAPASRAALATAALAGRRLAGMLAAGLFRALAGGRFPGRGLLRAAMLAAAAGFLATVVLLV